MIRCILVFNQTGKPRIIRFYDGSSFETQQWVYTKIYTLIINRATDSHISSIIDGSEIFEEGIKIVYRNYATLFFVYVFDTAESELSILDTIQVFVQTLSACFPNVCELDIVFNFDKVNYILDETVVGGMIADINVQSIVESIKANEVLTPAIGGTIATTALLPTNSLSGGIFR